MFKKLFLTSISAFLLSTVIFAVEIQPLDTTSQEQRKIIAKDLKKSNKNSVESLFADYSKNELSYVKPIFKKFDEGFNEDILTGNYIFYSGFDSIINDTHKQLNTANPFLNADCKFYVSRDISLNAMSTLYNTYVINLGTFYFMRNKDEFAAIIAHEHAHNYLKHQVKSFKNAYQMEKEDAKNTVKEIKKSKYGRGTKALSKYKDMLYSKGKITRMHEFEADSLGYILYKNAGYRSDHYLNAFRLMMEYDTIKIKDMDLSIYKKVFDLPNQAFKPEWLLKEDFSKYDYSKYKERFNPDSIKSHPEMEARIKNLIRLYPELGVENKDSVIADNQYKRLRKTAFYEIFQSLYISEDYGFGVYACLSELAEPDSNTEDEIKYYKKWLGKYFSKIHKARKEYTLNRYLDAVDPKDQSKDYQQFLNFMWNLKVNELEQIAIHYSK